MQAQPVYGRPATPNAATALAIAKLHVIDLERGGASLAVPRPEMHLVVRFGPSARGGLDAHVFGAHETLRRKFIAGSQRALAARLQLGAQRAVLGVDATTLAGHIVELEDLWGANTTQRLYQRIADAPRATDAAAILERAITERLTNTSWRRVGERLALAAAARLKRDDVNVVAAELGVSERHLRRVFRETVGVGPKTFAKLSRFHRALSANRATTRANWASIAASAGYYDQAHLIAEFRAIAGVTPSVLASELRNAVSVVD